MQHVHLRQRGEHFARQVDGGAVASRGVGELTGRLARGGNHILGGLHIGLDGVGHQHVGHHGQQAHRGKVLDGVVTQLAVQRLVGGHADGGDHQRVAIARLLGHEVGTNVAARAGLVLDDEGLAQRLASLLAQRARNGVHGAARREGHHPADGLAGPGGSRCLGAGCRQGGRGQGAGQQGQRLPFRHHGFVSLWGCCRCCRNQMAEGCVARGVTWIFMNGNRGRPCSSWCSSSLDDTSKML